MCWAGWVRLQLLPEPPDKYSEVLHLIRLRRPPYFAEQMAVGQHLAGMRDEVTQQVEFFGRQLDLLAATGDVATYEIDREVPRDKDRQLALRLKGVAQRGAQARHQLVHAKRLTEIIISAEVERLDL